MFKIVLACTLTISCSTVCSAKNSNDASNQLAQVVVPAPIQSESEPQLHGTLPLMPYQRPVDATTAAPGTTPTFTEKRFQSELKSFDATMPTLQTSYPPGALQGTANITDIAVSARNLTKCPLQRDHDKGLKYVEVTVKNSGQNIAVILCNSAQADVNAAKLSTAPASAAVDSDLPRLNGKGKLAVGVVAAFSFGYAAPIFYENLTPDQHRKRSLGDAIGRDGSRREVEAGHFGVRVIMPGDETTGWVAFRCPRDQEVKSLVIPISYTRSAVPSGSITVPVANSVTN